jgi:(p)ppGpp synthase/HD superfamily hydrolase
MKAQRMAYEAHSGQKYGGRHYVLHLYDAALVLAEFGFSPYMVEEDQRHHMQCIAIAVFLHDILEDTDLAYKDVRKEFGDEVADIVWAVTDEPGRNRKERHAKTYPKIRADWRAMAVKLADRVANVRNCLNENPRLLGMYVREWPEFKQALAGPAEERRPQIEAMWAHLEYLLGPYAARDTGAENT